MIYRKAIFDDIQSVYNVVQSTVNTIYPRYYPKEIVEFFCNLHSQAAVRDDVMGNLVGIISIEDEVVATGSFKDNHITRVYVLPRFEGQGYGTYIMKVMESEISKKYNKALLDASQPAEHFYETLGYQVISEEEYPVNSDVILDYKVMEKVFKA